MNTNLPGNPFEDMTDSPMSDGDMDTASVYATLALAYEQRTANLIALLDHLRSNTEYGATQADWPEIQDQITTRLGLDQETPDADH